MDLAGVVGVLAGVVGAAAAVAALFRKSLVRIEPSTAQLPPAGPQQAMKASTTKTKTDIFTHATGSFVRRPDGGWDEYNETADKVIYHFEEINHDGEYIYLKDPTRRKDPGRPFILRLPVAGGIAQWSYPNPFEWNDLTVVKAQHHPRSRTTKSER